MSLVVRFLFLLPLLFLVGCNTSPVVPVSGTISFDNRELPHTCRLTFVPQDNTEGIRPGGATMDPDGTYRVSPFKGVEGLLPGTYSVRVNYYDLKKGGNPSRDADFIEKTFEAGELVVEAGASAITHDIIVE